MTKSRTRWLATCMLAAALTLTACGTNKPSGKNSSPPPSGNGTTNAVANLKGSIAFNDDNLAKLRDQIKKALQGKDLSTVDNAVVVNVTAAYWNAAKTGAEKAADELGVKSTFQEPTTEDITQQLSILNTLLSQGITGFSVSAIQPSSLANTIRSAASKSVSMIAIDSPIQQYQQQMPIYLGTPNYDAGHKAGEAMKQLLPGGGDVAVLTGSLTATNSTQRIQGFKDALKGTKVKVFQVYNDGGDANKALQNASAAFQADPNLKAFYGVYSYDGPSAGQAVQSAGKSGKVMVVADDSEPKTLHLLQDGAIQAMVLQQPYQQGYMSEYLLTAMKVLGRDATMALVKPYLQSDGYTLSSGIGLVTKANLSAYQAKLASFGISSS